MSMAIFDEIAEKTGDSQWERMKEAGPHASDEIALFIARCRSGGDTEVIGSFNLCLRVTVRAIREINRTAPSFNLYACSTSMLTT